MRIKRWSILVLLARGCGVFKAAPLPLWVSTAARSHALQSSARGNLIPIFTGVHACAHPQRNRKYREDKNLKMCVVCLEACIISPERRGHDKAGSWDTERQVDRPADTDWLSPLGAVQRQVGASVKNTSSAVETVARRGRKTQAGESVCVCLLSKWSCLCLKVDCRLVLSLDTGALISVWLCWLSFSSSSTVQHEKPCGHTFSGAPETNRGIALYSQSLCD